MTRPVAKLEHRGHSNCIVDELPIGSGAWMEYHVFLIICPLLGAVLLTPPVIRRLFSANRVAMKPLKAGNIRVPNERKVQWKRTSREMERTVDRWASLKVPDWKTSGKTDAPRVLLAKLASGTGIRTANRYIRSVHPWGRCGSTWLLNPHGDYDFTLVPLTALLYLFGDDKTRLEGETRKHLLNRLLTEEGGRPGTSVPGTLFVIKETENHILMREGSRYLKNRWLRKHGSTDRSHDNRKNGMEHWMRLHLDELRKCGLYEFNSQPYLGFTIAALLNLEAFGSREVKEASGKVLDMICFISALGTYKGRRYPPFRRQKVRAASNSLNKELPLELLNLWLSAHPAFADGIDVKTESPHGILAALLPYRPPDKVAELLLRNDHEYYVRIGHGRCSTPEIYSKGPGYLISAGGSGRGPLSRIAARPITVMFDDDARELKDVIHLYGPGENRSGWNDTGVFRRFAVAAGSVHVPREWKPVVESARFRIYRKGKWSLCVHSREGLGIVVLSTDRPDVALAIIEHDNPNDHDLFHSFILPGGERVCYDPLSRRSRWVISSVSDEDVEREFDRWPRISGVFSG